MFHVCGEEGGRQWLRDGKQVSLIHTVYLPSHRKKNLNILVSSLGLSSGMEADNFLQTVREDHCIDCKEFAGRSAPDTPSCLCGHSANSPGRDH